MVNHVMGLWRETLFVTKGTLLTSITRNAIKKSFENILSLFV